MLLTCTGIYCSFLKLKSELLSKKKEKKDKKRGR
jgi:hypothetical protein